MFLEYINEKFSYGLRLRPRPRSRPRPLRLCVRLRDRGEYRSDNPRSSPKLFMNYFSHRMFSAQFDCTGLLGVKNSCTYKI